MPRRRGYGKKRNIKRKIQRNNKKYRRQIATIARPLNVKPRSAMQNVTYYNSFLCRPTLNANNPVGSKQQNFHFVMNLNSIWPFDNGFDSGASLFGQVLSPNETIHTYATPVTDQMTTMPNVRDGANLFDQYAGCCVVGTKVTLVATPIKNSGATQLGYLYAVKHSQPQTGLDQNSTIVDVNKLPYRRMAKLMGADDLGLAPSTKCGAKLVIKHSPKMFNQVKDYRDNPNLFNRTGSNSAAHKPTEADYLSVGCVGSLNGLDEKVTDFCLQIRIESRLLWTEPLESLSGGSSGQGNYSFPWSATLGAGAITAAGMYL